MIEAGRREPVSHRRRGIGASEAAVATPLVAYVTRGPTLAWFPRVPPSARAGSRGGIPVAAREEPQRARRRGPDQSARGPDDSALRKPDEPCCSGGPVADTHAHRRIGCRFAPSFEGANGNRQAAFIQQTQACRWFLGRCSVAIEEDWERRRCLRSARAAVTLWSLLACAHLAPPRGRGSEQ